MNRTIGPVTLSQRTPYSKVQLYVTETGENVSAQYEKLIEVLMKEYTEQTEHMEDYFDIVDSRLCNINRDAIENFRCVFIPEGVTAIDDKVLHNLSFEQISLPSTLIEIEDYTFNNCNKMEDIYIPDSVEFIGTGAFLRCGKLRSVRLPSSLEEINPFTFSKCSSLRGIVFPETITWIGAFAFEECRDLWNIKFGNNVEIIEHNAFYKCSSISEINLPNSLKEIGDDCFSCCVSLKNIIIPDSVEKMGDMIFNKCSWLESVKLPESLERLKSGMFYGCENLREIVIPDNISKIDSNAFENMPLVKAVNLPRDLNNFRLPIFTKQNRINTLIINHNIRKPKSFSATSLGADLITNSNITKLIIDKNVDFIDQGLFMISGPQITEIEYNGSKEEFEKFKNGNPNNKRLFRKWLCNVDKITCLEGKIEKDNIKDISR